jgi:hypothetical protein
VFALRRYGPSARALASARFGRGGRAVAPFYLCAGAAFVRPPSASSSVRTAAAVKVSMSRCRAPAAGGVMVKHVGHRIMRAGIRPVGA